MRRKVIAFIAVALVSLALGIIVSPATGLYDMTVRVVSSTGTVLNGTASAVTALYDKTVRIVNSSNQVIDSFGGSVPALQYTINNLGATNSPACNFNLGYICLWQESGDAVLTVSNIPGTTTAPVQITLIPQGTSGSLHQLTLPSSFYIFEQGNYFSSQVLHINNNGANAQSNVMTFSCNGTNCNASTGNYGPDVQTSILTTNTLQMANGGDNSVTTMARMPLSFPIAAVAATTTTQLWEMMFVKAITIENVVFNVGAFTCSVNPAISLFDCSATVGTCTPISTLATSGTLTAIGSTNAVTTPTANVAAGEYVAAEFTAGTCTVLNGSVQAMARPQ